MQRPVLVSASMPALWLAPPVAAWRRPAARALRWAGALLRRLARQLVGPTARPRAVGLASLPELEYHAEAGAPEGALYVNGDYVGRLDVQRL